MEKIEELKDKLIPTNFININISKLTILFIRNNNLQTIYDFEELYLLIIYLMILTSYILNFIL
jgi:hypothetical protein